MTPLLPVYATELGATPAVAGYYLSFSILMLYTVLQRDFGTLVIPSGTELPALSIAEGQRSGVEESRPHGNEISRLAALARNDVGAAVYFRNR